MKAVKKEKTTGEFLLLLLLSQEEILTFLKTSSESSLSQFSE
jgi:hypothetical protein